MRHLRAVQIRDRILRRLPRPTRYLQPPTRAARGVWVEPVWHEPAPLRRSCRLQEYARHYHERPGEDLVNAWIAANPPGGSAGWEPYPLSLRLVNWIKWLLGGAFATAKIQHSLTLQAAWLAQRLEFHLLGNHLFANAKALVFAGCFFHADHWLHRGLDMLAEQIPEQILPDGGHIERSPMYQLLILEDALDLVNLGRAYPGLLPDLAALAGRLLAWTRQMIHPDGQIAFFNDAAFGVAPEPELLFQYADRLKIEPASAALSESGYIRLENENTVVLFDAGHIGPDYQLAHAHADTLSFELSHRGQRLLVNSGISTYDKGVDRLSERGTAAHNTVRVDNCDQSEVWSSFRVARRARPFDVRTDQRTWAEAAHDGYHRLTAPVTHRRRLDLSSGRLRIIDSIEGVGRHRIDVFFHLYPGTVPEMRLPPNLQWTNLDTYFHPTFEASVRNRTIAGTYRGECPVSFETEILLP